jgi:hypothetical protein
MFIQPLIILILLVLLISVFSVLSAEFTYYKKYENARILKYVNISDIYDNLKSGDIILYKGNTLAITGVLSNTYYTHIGMVIKQDNGQDNGQDIKTDLYISETNPSYEYLPKDYKNKNNWYGLRPYYQTEPYNGWKTKYGSDLLPLLIRIKYFPGDCFIMRLNKELDQKRQKILYSAIQEFCPYPTPSQIIKMAIEKKILKSQKTYARHCFQHVAYLLDKMKLTNNILDSSGIVSICGEIGYIDGKKLNDGYTYDTPIKILYDI